MKNQKGFTAVELVAVVILLLFSGALFLYQRNETALYQRDSDRKTSINAIYHYLEKIYYPTQQAYPGQISEDTLTGLAPELLQDPSGSLINEPGSTLRYEPTDCENGKCSSYTLRADLENEADFVKPSNN